VPPILLFIFIFPFFSSEPFSFISFLIFFSIWDIVLGSLEDEKLDRELEKARYKIYFEGTFIGISGVIDLFMTD
jgi:hypothetical protein